MTQISADTTAAGNTGPIRRPRLLYRAIGKRVFDLVLGVILLPILMPVIAILWALVRLDGGPGFFGHHRVGQSGQGFRCWKIRTMAPDAETRLQELLARDPIAAAEWARDHKLTHDPRITRIGAFLRRTSLDELPQLWNVLRGQMSFVGPRPVTRDELRRYGAAAASYLSLRPGVTGMWQVSGRNEVSYAQRVAMDADYARRYGLWLDCAMILRTGGAVLLRTGR